MQNEDESLQPLDKQEIMETTEWERISSAIREKVSKIREQYGDAPREQIYARPGTAGDLFDYVREEFFIEILNEHFPDWSFLITDVGYIGQLVYVSGRLILNFKGIRRIFDDTGEDKAKLQKDSTMVPGAVKSATTDCFKRCCHRALGAAQNVYNIKDIERKVNVQSVKDVVTYCDEILDKPNEQLSSKHIENLRAARDYFSNKVENLPTYEKDWEKLLSNLDKFYKLKEAIDAERLQP